MCTKDLHRPSPVLPFTYLDLCACHPLPNIPVASEKGSRPSIECVPHHPTVFNWPFRQDCQSASEDAAVVEFTMWEDVIRLLPYGIEVLLSPAFLEGYDGGRRRKGGYFGTDLGESFGTVGC